MGRSAGYALGGVGVGRKPARMSASRRQLHRTVEVDEDEAAAAARWRVALSHAQVQAMKARSAAQAEAAVRADRLSKGFTAKPSPRERIKQQQTELNRAKIYAMNAVLARQADARWQELRREHGVQTPEPDPRLACTVSGGAQPAAVNNVGAATSPSQQTDLRSSSPLAMEAIAGRSKAQSTPPLTPPSAPSQTCMAGDLEPAGGAWKFDGPAAASPSPSPEVQLPLKEAREFRRGSSGGCCAYMRRRSGTKVTQQGRALQQPG